MTVMMITAWDYLCYEVANNRIYYMSLLFHIKQIITINGLYHSMVFSYILLLFMVVAIMPYNSQYCGMVLIDSQNCSFYSQL